MKNIKFIALYALFLLGVSAPAQVDFTAICETGQTLDYTILSENPPEVEIYHTEDYSGSLIIPASVSYNGTDYSVVSIGRGAFMGGSCTNFTGTLSIPNTVRSIGEQAFHGCTFTGPLVIPNSVTEIGSHAFMDCINFTSLTLSESLSIIEEFTFGVCTGFRGDLFIPESVYDVKYNAFYQCGFDGTLTLSPMMWYLQEGSFELCSNFTSVVIPEGVGYLDWNAMDFLVKPTELEIPSTMECMLDYAFCHLNRLTTMSVKATVPPYIEENTFQQVNRNIPVYIPQGTIENYRNAEYWCEFTNFIETEFDGINENESFTSVAVYPNPASDIVRIKGTKADEIHVFNAAGQLVKSVQNSNEVDLSDLNRGIYFISIVTKNKECLTRKIMKS